MIDPEGDGGILTLEISPMRTSITGGSDEDDSSGPIAVSTATGSSDGGSRICESQ